MDLQRLSSRLDWTDRKWFDLMDHFSHWEIREVQRAGVHENGRSYGRNAAGGETQPFRLLEAELWFRATLGPDGIAHLQNVRQGIANDTRNPNSLRSEIIHVSLQRPTDNRESKWRLFVRLMEPESLDAFYTKLINERNRWRAAQAERERENDAADALYYIVNNSPVLIGRCAQCGAEIPPRSRHNCVNRPTQSNRVTSDFTRESFERLLSRAMTPDQLSERVREFPRVGIQPQEPIAININAPWFGNPHEIGAALAQRITPGLRGGTLSPKEAATIAKKDHVRARIAQNRGTGAGFQTFEARVKALHRQIRDTLPDGKPVLKRFRRLEME